MSETKDVKPRTRCSMDRAVEIYIDRETYPTFKAAQEASGLSAWGQKVTALRKAFPEVDKLVPTYSGGTGLTNDEVRAMLAELVAEKLEAEAEADTPSEEEDTNPSDGGGDDASE